MYPNTNLPNPCWNHSRSIRSAFISAFIRHRKHLIEWRRNRHRSDKLSAQAALQCGRACVSSTVTVQSVPPGWRAHLPAPFMAKSIPTGQNGLLQRIGIDGIIVAREFDFIPRPEAEWELIAEADEGRVFHRRGKAMPMVRSVNFFGKNSIAKITDIVAGRDWVSASVAAPDGDRPSLIAVSRPFFPGYRARIGGRNLAVFSERNLIPLVEIPPGMHGRLTLYYRPDWLIYGSALAITSAAVWLISAFFAMRRPTQPA